jgi:LytS/YehU family sensor histidine kinase
VDADVLDAYVPGMILQPLVENALTHGIAPKVAGGTLRIAVTRGGDGASVVLRVEDDGVGLPAGGARERTGVGNTRGRLRAVYGDAHAFTLAPLPGGGTVSEVRVPFHTVPTRTAEFPVGTGAPNASWPASASARPAPAPVAVA